MMICLISFSCSLFISIFFFFKQKTAYEMRISDWSSDVCSSDLPGPIRRLPRRFADIFQPPVPIDRRGLLKAPHDLVFADPEAGPAATVDMSAHEPPEGGILPLCRAARPTGSIQRFHDVDSPLSPVMLHLERVQALEAPPFRSPNSQPTLHTLSL